VHAEGRGEARVTAAHAPWPEPAVSSPPGGCKYRGNARVQKKEATAGMTNEKEHEATKEAS
jgi:hypothetical protein